MSASQVSIVPVSSKGQQKAFIKFAWTLYEGDENWVPPLLMNIKELLNYKKHPFYDNAEIQTFLAITNGRVVGRIAAIVDGHHNDYHKEKLGMFGFFECIDDQQVANQLFDTAKAWFAERGIHRMRGPANPSQNYEWGMLVEGFHSPPTFMMTYNKEYYGKLVEGYGFEKSQDMFAFMGHVDMLQNLDPKLLFIAEEAKRRFNVEVRPIHSGKDFAKDVDSFLEIYNAALPGQWGFTPMSAGELRATASGLKMLIIPQMTTFAEVDGKAVGAVFGLLDYNPLIKEIDGKLFPFGILKLLWKRKKITRMRMISTNVIPAYQRWGLGLVLMHRLGAPMFWHGGLRTRNSPGCLNPTSFLAVLWSVAGQNAKRPIEFMTTKLHNVSTACCQELSCTKHLFDRLRSLAAFPTNRYFHFPPPLS